MAKSSRASFRLESLEEIEGNLGKGIVASIEAQTAEIKNLGYALETILLELRRIRFGTSIIADNDLEEFAADL